MITAVVSYVVVNKDEYGSKTLVSDSSIKDWKVYNNQEFGFHISYPPHVGSFEQIFSVEKTWNVYACPNLTPKLRYETSYEILEGKEIAKGTGPCHEASFEDFAKHYNAIYDNPTTKIENANGAAIYIVKSTMEAVAKRGGFEVFTVTTVFVEYKQENGKYRALEFNLKADYLNEQSKNELPKIFSTFKFTNNITADNRILLTAQNISQYNSTNDPDCKEEFNNDPPSTTATYSSKVKGVSLQIPYNPKWGNEKYRINPYDEAKYQDDEQLSFGPINGFEGCSWVRDMFLHFKPAKSAEEVTKEITESNDPVLLPTPPTTIKINGLTVVKYETVGLCGYPTLQVIGKKYNYELVPLCFGEFKELEDIVKTISLIE